MHTRIVSFIKYNKVFLFLYQFFGNMFTAILRRLIRTKKKQVLFMSFGGKKYDDSPRVLYEQMRTDPFFQDYKLIWGFTDPQCFPIDSSVVKVDTLRFYAAAISSHIWITNSSVERGLRLKKKDCIEINTWHGTPLKKMGNDIENDSSYHSSGSQTDIPVTYCAQSEYDREIFTRFFHTTKDNIILSDLPRNDILLRYTDEQLTEIRKALSLPESKKVILYAPTFREYTRDKFNSCYISPPIDLQKWHEKLGAQYVILFRAHYEVVSVLGIRDDGFLRNVSSYPCLNDLIAVSDLLISDYSSIYFDYSVTEKPMFCFAYDLQEYTAKRGLYLDLGKVLPCDVNLDEDHLINELLTFDPKIYRERTRSFKNHFAPYAGNAAETVIEKLKGLIGSEPDSF